MEEHAWRERIIVGLLIALLFVAAAGITRLVDTVKGGGGNTCTYTSSDGSTYRSPCPEELPSGSDGP